VVAATLALCTVGAHADIKGSGSTFAGPLYQTWAQKFGGASGAGRLQYELTGSSAGVKAAEERSVDFGGSDRPLNRSTLDQAGLAQFPTAIGGVVIVTHVPQIDADKLKLSGEVLAGMYTGRIQQWNDPAIKVLNPDLQLPALHIVPVFRADGSGTSFVLTTYLSKQSPQFRSAVGITSNFAVPTGKAATSSAELVTLVRDTPGAIGYVDYTHAHELNIPAVQLKNQWGRFVSASSESLQVAMRAANWEKIVIEQDPTFELDLTDAGCPGCWPITYATYVLVPVKPGHESASRVLHFFNQAISQGDELAVKEGYVPLPNQAKNQVWLAMRRWQAALDKAAAARPNQRR
jgi:phosphate transport system substrate-binding protein